MNPCLASTCQTRFGYVTSTILCSWMLDNNSHKARHCMFFLSWWFSAVDCYQCEEKSTLYAAGRMSTWKWHFTCVSGLIPGNGSWPSIFGPRNPSWDFHQPWPWVPTTAPNSQFWSDLKPSEPRELIHVLEPIVQNFAKHIVSLLALLGCRSACKPSNVWYSSLESRWPYDQGEDKSGTKMKMRVPLCLSNALSS